VRLAVVALGKGWDHCRPLFRKTCGVRNDGRWAPAIARRFPPNAVSAWSLLSAPPLVGRGCWRGRFGDATGWVSGGVIWRSWRSRVAIA